MTDDFHGETTRATAPDVGLKLPTIEAIVLESGARVRLEGIARVGAAPANEIAIDDPHVSRLHCELVVVPDGIRVRDLGSTNGTFFDGARITEAVVPLGAVLHVGKCALRLSATEEPTFIAVSPSTEWGELVGASVEMRSLFAVLDRIAVTDTTVLVMGETGTGKDVLARSLHAQSARSAGPFVAIDCGAIPEHLVESELFGHVRGAFSGAVSNRRGVFEEANGGTLFLDEIGEMPLALQPKLLRAIESRTIRRVGANQAVPIDVRIVAATNRSLASAVNEGSFREDLYYRLAVVELTVPPLRARRSDVPVLAAHFFEKLTGKKAPLPVSFVDKLRGRAWPGNVRELRNFIERHVALGQLVDAHVTDAPVRTEEPSALLPSGLETIIPTHLPLKEARERWTEEFESLYVRAMLQRTQGNVTRAAELAGVSRRFLQRTMARLGLRDVEPDE